MHLRDSRHPGLTGPRPVGRGNSLWITYVLPRPHNDMEVLPGWGISSMPWPPPRQHEQKRRYTPITHPFILIRRIWKDDYDGQMIFGDLVSLKLQDICLTGKEKPEKTSPRKPVPTGDRTMACCVTGAHATACSTEVEKFHIALKIFLCRIRCQFFWIIIR